MTNKRYFIKEGYHPAGDLKQSAMFQGQQDSISDSSVWQYETYEYAQYLIKKYRLKSVLDIGCGCGVKLKKLILPLCSDIIGVDEEETIAWCKQNQNFGRWFSDNLENPKLDLGRTFDLIVSADVIEHLINPDNLLRLIKKFARKDTLIVLSTPERDIVRGKNDMGPPKNPLHAREWNMHEMRLYVESEGFKIIKHIRIESSTPLTFQFVRARTLRRLLAMLNNPRKLRLDSQLLLLKI
ncbi:MAG: methyltransferase domain-containing protein [Dehalococcoidales bacterium]|nr:methyltransferase domain-containing protein [Dehalococcoidales bacterium]